MLVAVYGGQIGDVVGTWWSLLFARLVGDLQGLLEVDCGGWGVHESPCGVVWVGCFARQNRPKW